MTAEPTEVVVRLRLEYPSGAAQASAVPVADSGPLLYNVRDAATLLAVSETIAWELVSSRALESLKIGGSRRISRQAIEQYIASLEGGDGDG